LNDLADAAAAPPAGGVAAPFSCLAEAKQERWERTFKKEKNI
jgi:hypothetical protein